MLIAEVSLLYFCCISFILITKFIWCVFLHFYCKKCLCGYHCHCCSSQLNFRIPSINILACTCSFQGIVGLETEFGTLHIKVSDHAFVRFVFQMPLTSQLWCAPLMELIYFFRFFDFMHLFKSQSLD